jgi:hypothetical protein
MGTEEEAYQVTTPVKTRSVSPATSSAKTPAKKGTPTFSMVWNRNSTVPPPSKQRHAKKSQEADQTALGWNPETIKSYKSFVKYCQIHGRDAQGPLGKLPARIPLNRAGGSIHYLSSPNTPGPTGDAAPGTNKFAEAAHGLFEMWKPTTPLSSRDDSEFRNYCQHHPLGRHAQTLRFTQGDILKVAMDDQTFQSLKDGLRKRGVITNNYLRENLHFYVQHIKELEARREKRRTARTYSPYRKSAAT